MRINFKSKSNSPYLKVAYKLLHDSLFLIILFFLGALIMEGILPGIISSHIGLYKIILAIAINLSAITIFQKKSPRAFPLSSAVKLSRGKIFWTFLFIIFAVILNGLIRLKLFLIPMFVFLIAASIYFSYKVIFETA